MNQGILWGVGLKIGVFRVLGYEGFMKYRGFYSKFN
jgi:hypothetical protein